MALDEYPRSYRLSRMVRVHSLVSTEEMTDADVEETRETLEAGGFELLEGYNGARF